MAPYQGRLEMSAEPHIDFAAGVLVLNDRDEVLLIKRRQDAHVAPGLWTRPIGKVKFGETSVQAAVRETLEETDVIVEIPSAAPHDVWESIHLNEGRHCVVREHLGRYVSGEARNTEPDKHDNVQWFPLTDLPSNLSLGTSKAINLVRKS